MVTRLIFSYARLFIASCLFMGGIGLQFFPTAAGMAREARWRERQLQTVPAHLQAAWIESRDFEDASSQAYVRLWGVLMGGFGLAMSLRETAYLSGRYSR
jgi:hypothetical protein